MAAQKLDALNLDDPSTPLSVLLPKAARVIHERTSVSPWIRRLSSKELRKEHYIQYLMMLWHVYDHLERVLEQHSTHPVLEPTYNPTLLERKPSLSADIANLLEVPESTWQSHSLYQTLMSSASLIITNYTDHITALANSDDPSLLLAHSYVRYVGDLSGGYYVGQAVMKRFDLDEGGPGVEFYVFNELGGGGQKPAGLAEMKVIKEWYRAGMDQGVGNNADLKATMMKEVLNAYKFNNQLFGAMETLVAKHSLEEGKMLSKASSEVAPITIGKGLLFKFASVAVFIAAACLTQIIFVTGRFHGTPQ